MHPPRRFRSCLTPPALCQHRRRQHHHKPHSNPTTPKGTRRHATLTTTQLYTHVAPVDLQRVHATTSPSERRRKTDVPAFTLRGFRDKKTKRGPR